MSDGEGQCYLPVKAGGEPLTIRCLLAQPEGFSFVRRDDLILISSGNRAVTTLKGDAASRFLARAESLDELGLQHLMARATGNFKRGNERAAGED